MHTISAKARRIAEIVAGDSLPTTAAKVQLAGGKVTAQGVHKWLHGGEISEANLDALAKAYNTTPAYIRYGVEPMELSESQRAAAELVKEEPEAVQEAFDFLQYRFSRSIADDPDKLRRYMGMIEKIRKGGKR